MNLRTTYAYLLTLLILACGFVWATFYTDAPYTTFSGTIGLVFGAYVGKRLLQKKEEFNENLRHPEK